MPLPNNIFSATCALEKPELSGISEYFLNLFLNLFCTIILTIPIHINKIQIVIPYRFIFFFFYYLSPNIIPQRSLHPNDKINISKIVKTSLRKRKKHQ